MNGPEHYREAERLLEESRDDRCDYQGAQVRIVAAQVHATLALAAATAHAGLIGHTLAASHAVNDLAHDDETITAVNDWHEVAAR
ncbi:hypothetical protein [Gordonia sp. WA4-43]|uniref:hypothetical protein n=1 Tax=Gordonia sp. WA4-43 TaxID=2878678 RepID=UPI001CFC313C|nr:hypothetical protein [Gordonia sp. WA4-43]UCZ88613.1 hypothetical protein LEL84_16205 [Gordonia sp. WA4-43]